MHIDAQLFPSLVANGVDLADPHALFAHVLWLLDDEQLITAAELLTMLESDSETSATIFESLEAKRGVLSALKMAATVCKKEKADFDLESGWIQVQKTSHGITTYCKKV